MSKKDTCDIYCYDEDKVNRIQGKMQKEDISSVSQLFKALADENRAKITYALCRRKNCVYVMLPILLVHCCDSFSSFTNLYKQGIVKFRKEGKLAFYSLDDDHIKQINYDCIST